MKSKILLVLTALFGLMMINSGLNKFFNYMPMPELSPELMAVFMALVAAKWILPLVAIGEIVGGVLIAVPKYRALGAIIIFPVMIGILAHHLTHDLGGIGVGIALFAINVWVVVESRDRYLHLIR